MRKIVLLVGLLLAGVSGCSMPWERAHCGWYAGIIKPATLDQPNQVLIQPNLMNGNASPIGSVAGPVLDGQHTLGQTQQAVPLVMPRAGAVLSECAPCPPYPQHPRLTFQQWCEMQRQAKGTALPMPKESQEE